MKLDRAGVRPAVEIRRSADRNETKIDWLHGRHSFDTGVDAFGRDTHHGVLVVNNHDTIAPLTGFDTHGHRDLEIVTWVLGGAVVHQDSEGHSGLIYPNLAQRMSAGRGIRHSERNDRPTSGSTPEPLELVQMWIVPDELRLTPSYEQLELAPADLAGKFAVVASGMDKHRDVSAIRLNNRYAGLQVARLAPADSVELPDAPFVHFYVARGVVNLEGAGELREGDAARLTAAGGRRATAVTAAEVLAWEMHATIT
ncbi:MAG: quercetin 2,3-dioxygenase [Marmoricola sp.]|nr:quercetin 2,3-dioxygenase [Marmoricola sp.]